MVKFQLTYRYTDDVYLLNVQNPREFLSPAYPRVEDYSFWKYTINILKIKVENSTFSSLDPTKIMVAQFMNIDLCVNELHPELYRFRKFDKRQNLPFSYTQYIRSLSNRAVHQAHNIVVSQLVPILYISNYDAAAMDKIKILHTTIYTNGFFKPQLLNIINKFFFGN
jgi:hypothetical protein